LEAENRPDHTGEAPAAHADEPAATHDMTTNTSGENLPVTGNPTAVSTAPDAAVAAPEVQHLRPHQFASPPVWTEPPKKRSRFNWIFLITVVLPTAIATLYYGLIASDVYISESRFVVRSPQRQVQTGLAALLQGSGFSRSQDDTYSVHDFVLSRDALTELDKKLGVRKAYASEENDFINRFPGLDWDNSFEAFHRYYRKQVAIDYDTASSITTLKVRAFSAETSKNVNDLLLQMGERLVNNLNDRSRQDLIKTAEQEVQIAEEKIKNAATALAGFRNTQTVFDPERQSALQLQGVAKLQEELLTTQAQLEQVRRVSPNNPQIGSLNSRVENLRKSIADETAKVAGASGSLTSKSAAYERFALDKIFAEKQLAAALTSLETARSEAQRKQLYLERLVQPNLPDKATEPRRIRGILMVFVLGMVSWGVLTLLVASVREHVD
jgi:capsular polysaccharide transport system permease protein